jgi:ABC-type amino acid transport substrate-binding protein
MKDRAHRYDSGDSPGSLGEVLTVGVDESPPPPLCYGLPDSPDFQGFEVDLLKAIAAILGVTLRCKSALWGVALDELQSGRLDMICTAATITPKRRELVDFSDPYFETELALIVRRDDAIEHVSDLTGRTVGVRLATVAEDFVREHCRSSVVRTFDLNVDAYHALCNGQVDAIVDDRPIGRFFARAIEGLNVAPPLAGTRSQYGMVFAKNNDRLRRAVNQALADVRADGTWERLYRRWFEEGGSQ